MIIAAGSWHSLALRAGGTVRAWGRNEYGQLGDGTKTDRITPVAVSGLSGVQALAAGRCHSLALLEDGTLRAWGPTTTASSGTGRCATAAPRWRYRG